MTHQMAVVLTTVANEVSAAEMGEVLIREKLAACIQEVTINSRYRWKGSMQCDREILLLIKTASDRVAETVAAIRKQHQYDLPEIVVLPVSAGLADYIAWVHAETRAD